MIVYEIHDTYQKNFHLQENVKRVGLNSEDSYFKKLCELVKSTLIKSAASGNQIPKKSFPGLNKQANEILFILKDYIQEVHRLYTRGWGAQ